MADPWIVISAGAAAISTFFAMISARIASRAYSESVKENKRRENAEREAREIEALNYLSTFDLENWNLWGGGPTPTTPAWNELRDSIVKLVSYRGSVPESFKGDYNLLCEYMSHDSPSSDPRFKDGMKLLENLRKRAHEEMRKR